MVWILSNQDGWNKTFYFVDVDRFDMPRYLQAVQTKLNQSGASVLHIVGKAPTIEWAHRPGNYMGIEEFQGAVDVEGNCFDEDGTFLPLENLDSYRW